MIILHCCLPSCLQIKGGYHTWAGNRYGMATVLRGLRTLVGPVRALGKASSCPAELAVPAPASTAPACQQCLFTSHTLAVPLLAMQSGDGGGTSSNADSTGDLQGPKGSGAGTGIASEKSAAGG
jgi:hypothetical protein